MELGLNVWPITRPDPEVFDPVTRPGWYDRSRFSACNSSKLRVPTLQQQRFQTTGWRVTRPDLTKTVDPWPGAIFSVLACECSVYHSVASVDVQCLSQLVAHRIFTKSVHLLCDEQCTKIVFNALEGNYALCLLGKPQILFSAACYAKARFPLPELTAKLTGDRFPLPVNTGRVDG